jgi:hypothetical protein
MIETTICIPNPTCHRNILDPKSEDNHQDDLYRRRPQSQQRGTRSQEPQRLGGETFGGTGGNWAEFSGCSRVSFGGLNGPPFIRKSEVWWYHSWILRAKKLDLFAVWAWIPKLLKKEQIQYCFFALAASSASTYR